MDHSKFQERLRDYVVKKHISTSQIARQAMISRQTMSNILNNKQDIRLSTAIKVVRALNINFFDINTFDDLENYRTFDQSMTADTYLNVIVQNVNRYCSKRPRKSLSTFPGISEAEISNILNKKVMDPYMSSLEALINNTEFNDLATAMKRR